ncbi:MAG TPA: NUDIX domain-containing protein [Candidatus Saccharibacteria bacterium]|nr:NUDIX domain-containing protein [Candidatus Saccharibacteria bacterium]HRK93891.1 NUDIX domain-containing protein [Candidatus Saccharibacteria bacterium]
MANSSPDELWQGYSEQGLPTRAITKQQARTGELHGAAHVWIWRRGNQEKEILLQVRALDKLTWPGFLDISAAGHIDYGETPIETAVRETEEEIGVRVAMDRLVLISVQHDRLKHDDLIENEYQWLYTYELNEEPIVLEDGEVDSVKWLTLTQFRNLVRGLSPGEKLVPHSRAYFAALLKNLE